MGGSYHHNGGAGVLALGSALLATAPLCLYSMSWITGAAWGLNLITGSSETWLNNPESGSISPRQLLIDPVHARRGFVNVLLEIRIIGIEVIEPPWPAYSLPPGSPPWEAKPQPKENIDSKQRELMSPGLCGIGPRLSEIHASLKLKKPAPPKKLLKFL